MTKKKKNSEHEEKSNAMAKNAAAEVPYILAMHGELHLASILERLRERGHSIKYQSLSAALSVAAKKKQIYKRTAPATFALRVDALRRINSEIKD